MTIRRIPDKKRYVLNSYISNEEFLQLMGELNLNTFQISSRLQIDRRHVRGWWSGKEPVPYYVGQILKAFKRIKHLEGMLRELGVSRAEMKPHTVYNPYLEDNQDSETS